MVGFNTKKDKVNNGEEEWNFEGQRDGMKEHNLWFKAWVGLSFCSIGKSLFMVGLMLLMENVGPLTNGFYIVGEYCLNMNS